MKNVVGTVLKIIAALAAIAGIVYVVATYGDRIVAWAKRLWERMFGGDEFCYFCDDEDCCCEDDVAADPADFEN